MIRAAVLPPPPAASLRRLAAAVFGSVLVCSNAAGTIFTVTNTNDSGNGSLRQAIIDANLSGGPDVINFNIAGDGPQVIAPASDLPEIFGTVHINGKSDPDYSPRIGDPVVVLDGANVRQVGLSFSGSEVAGSVVEGLRIVRFNVPANPQSSGIRVAGPGVTILGNYLGTDGTADQGNYQGVFAIGRVTIGGPTRAQRNVISGNDFANVRCNTTGAKIIGNFIGTNRAGSAAIDPNTTTGILVDINNSSGSGPFIGGATEGERNIISGHEVGLSINSSNGLLVNVLGNYIGTNAAGTAAVANTVGIDLKVAAVRIGGDSAAERNVISGNGTGIRAGTQSFTGARIHGNYIGLNAAGTAALGNGTGINMDVNTANLTVGGSGASEGNVISGNGTGISMRATGRNIIRGNKIGSDPSGTTAMGNTAAGVQIFWVLSQSSTDRGDNVVGGSTPASGNIIAFNGGPGVVIGDHATFGLGNGNAVRLNSIHSNGGLGIDLTRNEEAKADGVSANDAGDGDIGPNRMQNFPVLSSAVANEAGTTVHGSLSSTPNTNFLIDLYASDATDPSGHGEGQRYLGTVSTTTNGNGNASFAGTFASVAGQFITSTATTVTESAAGDTSEFSMPVEIVSAGAFRFVSGTYSVGESDGSAVITVERIGGSSGAASVQYSTANGTAMQGSDYTSTAGVLNFAPGQSTLTFSVSILDDEADEPAETVDLTLSNPGGGATLASPTSAVLTIADDDLPPRLANIATRLRVGTGDNALIGGFIVTGSAPKQLIVRAIGPSLPVNGALGDPFLEIYDSADNLLATNDNWKDAQQSAIEGTGIPPESDLEAAVVISLNPGAYTAVVRGINDGTGIGLVEVYDLELGADSRLANISTRGVVQTGDDAMIGGIIVVGDGSQRVIVRAIGPSLPVAGKLENPRLELFDGNGNTLQSNDNWKDTQQAEIEATTIPPQNDLESAIVTVLQPAGYTAVVRGVNDTTGLALVEAYALP